MNKSIVLLLLVVITLAAVPDVAEARLPYRTYYYDRNQSSWTPIQAVYTPESAIAAGLKEPVDLHIGTDDRIYIADKGANQIVVLDKDGELVSRIGAEEGDGSLLAPEGVFTAADGRIYVADSGHSRIAVFSPEGAFVRAYAKPESAAFSAEHFVPQKLVVDRRGVMYVALNTSYQGLVRINADGEFMGYFGANKAQQTFMNWLKKLILTKEQLEKELANLPLPITNVALDGSGFIYTATAGSWGAGAVRKLNAGGVDAFKNKTLSGAHGIVDVAMDHDGFLYSMDMEDGHIMIYDADGEALFSFSKITTETQQYGILGFPTAIGVDSGSNIWIADSKTKVIHKFSRTAFGRDLMQAVALYRAGKYEESKAYWERVYSRNDMYNGTFQGLGKVYLNEGRNEEALAFMQEALDTEGYSRAFWQIRLQWLQENFLALCAALAGTALLWIAGKRLLPRAIDKVSWPKRLRGFGNHMRDFWYILFHPYEGFYRLKEARVPGLLLILIMAMAVTVKVLSLYLTGFLFHPVELSQVNVVSSLAFFIAPWVTWILANYLVCSVKDGEGKFREVLQGSTFALIPYVFFSIPILILSNLVSLDERILVDSLNVLMYIWLGIMFFVMTQVIHNFEFIETLKNTAITMFTIVVMWLFGFIVFGLSFNLYDFFYQLYQEVFYYA